MANAQATQSHKRKLHSLWTQCIAVIVSLMMNLVTVSYITPLYKDTGGERNRYKVIVKEEKKTTSKNYMAPTVQEINVSATSGCRPTKDSIISLDHGDPTMFEDFWAKKGEEATVVIPGWQTLSYFSDVTNVCWFLERDFGQEVRRLHKLVGNAVTEDRYIVIGTGSTQLYQAAVFALSPPDASEPMSVVS